MTSRKLSDRYELGETLGFGGMSEVHLARDVLLDRDVAVKVLRADLARDPTFYLRFRREAQNAAALNHPTIVQVFDTGEATTPSGPLPFIVMEYVEGETLRDILRREGRIAPRQAMMWFADICAALDFSHQNGIVHRDMKPANVMIDKAGAVKVMDFGIARAMNDSTNTMTQTAAVIGTAQYLSPEQARGEKVDARSDVYSLGCVLFELLTGEPPFTGDTPLAVAYQHVREDPPTPSSKFDGVPQELDSIVMKAMSKNRENRYQSAAAMRSDLMKVLAGGRPSAPIVMSPDDRQALLDTGPRNRVTPPPLRRSERDDDAERPRRRRPVLKWSLVAVALIAVISMLTLFLIRPWAHESTPEIAVPSIEGMSTADARVELEKYGFKVATKPDNSNTVPSGRPIDTDPKQGKRLERGSTVTIVVSSGPRSVDMPDVVGKTPEQAAAALEKAGIVGRIKQREGDSTEAQRGKVIASDPRNGTSLKVTDAVTLTVGSGPKQYQLPNLVGLTLDQARAQVGNNVTLVPVYADSTENKDTILNSSPEAGSTVNVGSRIQVTISRNNQFTMPDLKGLTPAEARVRLEQSGWSGSTLQQDQKNLGLGDPNTGKVVGQKQSAGSTLDKNATVEIQVGRFAPFG